jgi:hypothetical protein
VRRCRCLSRLDRPLLPLSLLASNKDGSDKALFAIALTLLFLLLLPLFALALILFLCALVLYLADGSSVLLMTVAEGGSGSSVATGGDVAMVAVVLVVVVVAVVMVELFCRSPLSTHVREILGRVRAARSEDDL